MTTMTTTTTTTTITEETKKQIKRLKAVGGLCNQKCSNNTKLFKVCTVSPTSNYDVHSVHDKCVRNKCPLTWFANEHNWATLALAATTASASAATLSGCLDSGGIRVGEQLDYVRTEFFTSQSHLDGPEKMQLETVRSCVCVFLLTLKSSLPVSTTGKKMHKIFLAQKCTKAKKLLHGNHSLYTRAEKQQCSLQKWIPTYHH